MKYKNLIMCVFLILLILAEQKKPRRVILDPESNPRNIMISKKLKDKNCKLFATKWSIAGWNDNEIKYFHKHNVRCPKNNALKYFRLFTNSKRAKLQRGSYSMRFKFICCKIKTHNCEKKITKSITGTNTYTLARIGDVKCGCEKVFTGFHIMTKFDNFGKNPRTNINYKCCNIYQKNLKKFKIHKKETGFTDSGFGRNIHLDRHQINCGRNGFIRNFHAFTKAKNRSGFNPYLKFKYSCLIPVVRKIVKKKKVVKNKISRINTNLKTIQKLLSLGTNKNLSIFAK